MSAGTENEPLETKGSLTKETLVEIIRNLLETDHPLDFLMSLENRESEDLTACIRERLDRCGDAMRDAAAAECNVYFFAGP